MKKFLFPAIAVAMLAMPCQADARTRRIPITFRDTSGIRPYVPVKLNGKPYLFMVHANAALMAMTIHANANAANVTYLGNHHNGFGITTTGKTSELGYDSAKATTFDVGGFVIRNMPIGVFEIPQDVPVNGMIGIQWLRTAKAFLDFDGAQLALPETHKDAERERHRLLSRGYIAVPMQWDSSNPREAVYNVDAKVNGATGRFHVSTVASVILDDQFAHRAGIAMSDQTDRFGGPTGTTGETRTSAGSYTLELAGMTLKPTVASIYDIYTYGNDKRPEDPARQTAGYLGYDFMKANHAVLDFESGTMFLRKRAR